MATIAWDILKTGTNDFVAVPDDVVAPSMALLASNDPPVVAGESAVAERAVFFLKKADTPRRMPSVSAEDPCRSEGVRRSPRPEKRSPKIDRQK